MNTPFDRCNDVILRTIAHALIDARQWHSLAELAQTSRQWHRIAQPLIARYNNECEARVTLAHVETPMCCRIWRDEDGKKHRYHDLPALVFANGTREWYWHGKLHRTVAHQEWKAIAKPAVICANGTQMWYQEGKLHRADGPALVEANGTLEWYQRGNLHRASIFGEDVGPAVIYKNGTQLWYQHGALHRDNGPAAGASGRSKPAVVRMGGIHEWWFRGRYICSDIVA
jgi:hypothetical protein